MASTHRVEDATPDLIDVTERADGDRLVLACRGELDHFSAPVLRAAVERARASGWRRIVLDLRGLDFMDSGGVHLLEDARDGRLGDADFAMEDGHAATALPVQVIGGPRLLPAARLDDATRG